MIKPSYLKSLSILGLFCLAQAQMATAAASITDAGASYADEKELIIHYRSQERSKAALKAFQKLGGKLQRRINRFNTELWRFDDAQQAQAALQALQADPGVVVEPNYRRYPRFTVNDAYQVQHQYTRLQQITVDQAWDQLSGDASNVIIAVIDDAIDISHPDLAANIIQPWDFIDNDPDPSPETCEGLQSGFNPQGLELHGTWVTGVMGAVHNNGIGVAGVSRNARIMPLRIGCEYTVAAELKAMEYALEKGADIINMSYGGPMYSETERLAIAQLQYSGVLVVTAAGNAYLDNDEVRDYPSGLDLPNIIVVGATLSTDIFRKAPWSQYGQTSVDVFAPGEYILTTDARGHSNPNPQDPFDNDDYINIAAGGTSFTAPMVSGIAALIKARYPAADYRTMKGAIMGTVRPLANKRPLSSAQGVVDANAALIKAGQPQPVVVIKSIDVDDSRFGNNNGLADAFENVSLQITLENVWMQGDTVIAQLIPHQSDAVNMLSSALSYELTAAQGYQATRNFLLSFNTLSNHTQLGFDLVLSSREWSSDVVRSFELSIMPVLNGVPRLARMDRGDEFENFHYYHFRIPSNAADLYVELSLPADSGGLSARNLDLILKRASMPQYDFTALSSLYDGDLSIYVENGVEVSRQRGLYDRIYIKKPHPGDYYLMVAASDDNDYPTIDYRLDMSYGKRKIASKSATLFSHPLHAMLFLALIAVFIFRHHQQRH